MIALRTRFHRRSLAKAPAVAMLAAIALGGCASVPPRDAVSNPDHLRAEVPGFPPIRLWGDELPTDVEQMREGQRVALGRAYVEQGSPPEGLDVHFLALSGGSSNGAFGAGLLVGWTESGTRPEFNIVTGISTGALIAPFAFLGPEYDDGLRQAFTGEQASEFAELQILSVLFGALSVLDPDPLREAIDDFASKEMLTAIAAEHRRGRRLLIGTTNLDAGRSVIWNIGRIANSGSPEALDLFRDILLASASIPGAYPPVLIDVAVDGRRFQEVHVDGGVTTSVFTYPFQLEIDVDEEFDVPVNPHLYVIQNNHLRPIYNEVELAIGGLVGTSFSTLIRNQAIGDIFRIYFASRRDGFDFHLAFIPPEFDEVPEQEFDLDYMNNLFDLGYRLAVDGYPWHRAPPGIDPAAEEPVAEETADAEPVAIAEVD